MAMYSPILTAGILTSDNRNVNLQSPECWLIGGCRTSRTTAAVRACGDRHTHCMAAVVHPALHKKDSCLTALNF